MGEVRVGPGRGLWLGTGWGGREAKILGTCGNKAQNLKGS